MATQAFFKIPAAQSTPVPALFQMVASAPLTTSLSGDTGDNFKIPLPNPTKAGNTIVLFITYAAGSPVVTDNNGNTWGAAVTSVAGAVNISAVFVLQNANAGQTRLNVAFGQNINPFQYTVMEFYNVATSGGVSGSVGQQGAQGITAIATGAFTPANNNANGGNLIVQYAAAVYPDGMHAPTSWSPAASWTLTDGDIATVAAVGLPHATQTFVQATSASINPTLTATGATGVDRYNTLAISLKAANAGSGPPTTIYVRKILNFMIQNSPSSWPLQVPHDGNLLVMTTFGGLGSSAVTDPGGTWSGTNTQNIIFYRTNQSPSQSLIVTTALGVFTGNPWMVSVFDVANALASPFDTSVEDLNVDYSGLTSGSNHPSITPSATGNLVITFASLGTGPGLSVTNPPGAIFDFTTYSNEGDNSSMTTANLLAHGIAQSTAAQSWSWTFTANAGNSSGACAASFKSA